MLNHYPLWKYIIILLVILAGILYSLPNLFGEDPALQITSTHGYVINKLIINKVKSILQQQNIINKSVLFENGIILIRFFNQDAQLLAHKYLIHSLGNNYIVAIHLAPNTPKWLNIIGAKPIKLGLDLRGGVHFLIELNIDIALEKLQEHMVNTICNNLNKKFIPYIKINKIDNYGIEIYFQDIIIRDQAISWLSKDNIEYDINIVNDKILCITLSNNFQHNLKERAIKQNVIILRNRINQLGMTDPLIQRQGTSHIVVELPGVQDIAYFKEIISANAYLEFRLINNVIDKLSINNKFLPIDSELKFTRDGQPILVYKKVILTGNHIIDSFSNTDEYNRPQVNISLDKKGTDIFYDFTKNNIGKLMATIFIEYKDSGKKDNNGKNILIKREEIINIAMIQSRLSKNFRIVGLNNRKEAHYLAMLLRSGSMDIPIQIIEERIIGPTLGLYNINQGLKACLWGLIVSILFMIVWYHKFGLIAAISLIANLSLMIGIISILPEVILTMPGIAGIVLSLAFAVDANVLIYERIKEEIFNRRSAHKAIHYGYHGAFSSIVDANITTLITTTILYNVSTPAIKSFAITTIVGVITSMFMSIMVTRAIVNLVYGHKHINKLPI